MAAIFRRDTGDKMVDDDIRKKQIAKLKAEIAGMDEIFYEDFDRFEKTYDLSRKTVMAISYRSGKYDHEAHVRAREFDSLNEEHLDTDIVRSSSSTDTQYGVLQPVANTGAGCFRWMLWLVLMFLVIAAGASLFT